MKRAFSMLSWKKRARPYCLASCSAASVRATAPASRPLRRARRKKPRLQRATASLEEESNDALSPAIRRLIAEHDLDAGAIKGTGVGGRITREDVEAHLAKGGAAAKPAAAAEAAPQPALAGRSENACR